MENEKELSKAEMTGNGDMANVDVRYLTIKQLNDACKKHSYILVRFASGYQMGINSKVAPIAQKRKKHDDGELTEFVGFSPCNINTYITHKHPFV